MKVYITVLKTPGNFDIKKITGVYSNKKAAKKAIAIPPGYRQSSICYEGIEEHEVFEEATDD